MEVNVLIKSSIYSLYFFSPLLVDYFSGGRDFLRQLCKPIAKHRTGHALVFNICVEGVPSKGTVGLCSMSGVDDRGKKVV